MKTNVQIIQKEFNILANGDTTQCTILGKMTLPEKLIEIASDLPGFKRFMKAQTGILWYKNNKIEITSTAYAHRHETDTPNANFGRYIASSKASKLLFKLAFNFQDNLRWFIISKAFVNSLASGIVGCANAMNFYEAHLKRINND